MKWKDRARLALHWLSDNILRFAIGYGLYPARSLAILGVVFVAGWALYGWANGLQMMAPTEEKAYAAFHKHEAIDWVQPFSAGMYALENCLPLVKFGQDDKWQPDPHPVPNPTLAGGFWFRLRHREWTPPVWVLTVYRRFMILAGWVLATFFASAVTGIVKKE